MKPDTSTSTQHICPSFWLGLCRAALHLPSSGCLALAKFQQDDSSIEGDRRSSMLGHSCRSFHSKPPRVLCRQCSSPVSVCSAFCAEPHAAISPCWHSHAPTIMVVEHLPFCANEVSIPVYRFGGRSPWLAGTDPETQMFTKTSGDWPAASRPGRSSGFGFQRRAGSAVLCTASRWPGALCALHMKS